MNLTIQGVMNNGHTPTLAEIRNLSARLGLPVTKSKNEMIAALGEYERETEALRTECARRGLETDGDRTTLERRLSQADANAVSANDRHTYWITVAIAFAMGLAGLAISLPHISESIAHLMGCGLMYGWLMGIVIDGGFITMKIIDTLGNKFKFNFYQKVVIRGIMAVCLVVSAALNAKQFLGNVSGGSAVEQCLAVVFAMFISVFVFSMFFVAASMLVRCEDKTKEKKEDADPATKLEEAAKELKRLRKAGSEM